MLSILGSWVEKFSSSAIAYDWKCQLHNGGPPLMRPLLRPHICLRRPHSLPNWASTCIHTNMAFFPPMTKVKRHFVSSDAMWYADVTKIVTLCDRLCHSLTTAWQASGQKDRRWCTSAVQPKNLENTGIFVFSRVCPCVCRKQTNKHGQSSLSVNQRFQDFSFNFKIKFAEK